MKFQFIAILMLIFAAETYGSERIFIGEVTEILLVPEGHEMCSPLCPNPPREIDGEVQICISNSCGCGEAKIRVQDSLTLLPEGKETNVRYRIGEWCMAGFPLTGETILIWETPGNSPAWGPIENPGTRSASFHTKDFEHLDSPTLKSISTSSETVRLSFLRRAVNELITENP